MTLKPSAERAYISDFTENAPYLPLDSYQSTYGGLNTQTLQNSFLICSVRTLTSAGTPLQRNATMFRLASLLLASWSHWHHQQMEAAETPLRDSWSAAGLYLCAVWLRLWMA